MAEIVTLFQETPLEFVRKNGPTLTHEVALRFNMDVQTALKAMKHLENHGLAKSRRVSFEHGAGYEWTVNQ